MRPRGAAREGSPTQQKLQQRCPVLPGITGIVTAAVFVFIQKKRASRRSGGAGFGRQKTQRASGKGYRFLNNGRGVFLKGLSGFLNSFLFRGFDNLFDQRFGI